MKTTTLFAGGVSTEPEVSRLMALNLQPGEIVPYSRIVELSGIKHKSARFQSVASAWRKRVFREQKLQSATVRGVGIQFLTESQALEKGIADTRRSAKAERRIATRVKHIDTGQLSEFERKNHDILGRYLRERDHAARMVTKEVAVPKAVTDTVVKIAPAKQRA